MDYLPNDIYSWLYFIFIICFLVIIILQAINRGIQKKYPVLRTQWKYYFWVLLAIICNVFLQIQFNSPGLFGGRTQSLPSMVHLFGLLPLIVVAYHGDPIDTEIVALVSVVSQLLSGNQNLFAIPFFMGFGLLVRYLSARKPRLLKKQPTNHPLFPVLWAMIVIYPFLIFTSLFFSKTGLLIRIENLFTIGQRYWILWFIPALIGGFLCELVVLTQKKGEFSKRPTLMQNEKKIFEEFALIFFIGFVLVSAQWQMFALKNYTVARERISILGEKILEDYTYFIEVGKSLTASYQDNAGFIDTAGTDQFQNVLAEIYHQVPYFEELSLYQGDQKIATYPDDASSVSWLKDPALQSRVEQIAGTELPYRVDTYQIENDQIVYYFYTPIKNSRFVLLGVTSPENNIFFSFDSQYYDAEAEFAWILTDSFGGELKGQNGTVLPDQVFDEIKNWEAGTDITGTQLRTGYGLGYFVEKQSGDYTCMFSGIILEEEIISKTLKELLPVLFFELMILFSVILFTKKRSKIIETDLEILLKKGINPEEIESFNQDGNLNHPALIQLYSGYKKKLSELLGQLSHERNSLKVIQDLSRVDSIDDIVEIIVKNKYLSSMGSLRLVLNPEIAYFLGHGRKTSSFGTGKNLNQYAHLDFELYSKMKNEQLRIISNCAKSEWLDPESKGEMPGSLTIFSLRSHDIYFGIVWIADVRAKKIDPIDIRFFNTVANQISVSLANMYVFRIEEAHKARTDYLIQSLPEPVLVMNRMLQLVLMNSAAKKLTKVFDPEATAGMSIEKFVQDQKLIQFLRQTLSSKVLFDQLSLANGREYSVNMVAAVEKTWYQNDWIICTLHDISAFREKDEIRSDFLGTVAQYLQTPLHTTSGYLAMLSMVGDLNQAQKDYVDSISHSVKKMDSFVNDLLDINRISSGLGLEYKLICATDMVNEVVNDLSQLAKQRHVKVFSTDLPRRLMSKVELDEKLFYQALYNLVKNGIENNLMAGEVEVKLELEGENLLFIIKDTGAGIAPLDVPNIFNRVQYHSTRNEGPGGGLELSLVKSIIDRHHGDVWVESDLGKGSTFYIRVPRVPQEKTKLN